MHSLDHHRQDAHVQEVQASTDQGAFERPDVEVHQGRAPESFHHRAAPGESAWPTYDRDESFYIHGLRRDANTARIVDRIAHSDLGVPSDG